MDMQNASNLNISEGEVKTIHDSTGNLLWGRLSYDNKYAGDTLQNGVPTPDAPVPIQIVTGEQTVAISDGENTHNYSISLGSIELCKLGDYQDYIYKSGADWYVHKETGKLVADGSEAGWSSSAVSGGRQFYVSIQGISTVSPRIIACDNFYYITGTTDENTTYINSSGLWVIYKPTSNGLPVATSTAEFKTWLGIHNTTLYYALATSTDTKITDTTLITQLNNVNKWLTRAGYNDTISGNLPLILDKTNL